MRESGNKMRERLDMLKSKPATEGINSCVDDHLWHSSGSEHTK